MTCYADELLGTARSPLGGNWISEQIRMMFAQSQPAVPVTPHYLITSKQPVDAGAPAQATLRSFAKPPHESFRRLQEERVFTEFKESCVQIWNPGMSGGRTMTADPEPVRNMPGKAFEMPDGWNGLFGYDRFRVAEGLFDEKAAFTVSEVNRAIHPEVNRSRTQHIKHQCENKQYQHWYNKHLLVLMLICVYICWRILS